MRWATHFVPEIGSVFSTSIQVVAWLRLDSHMVSARKADAKARTALTLRLIAGRYSSIARSVVDAAHRKKQSVTLANNPQNPIRRSLPHNRTTDRLPHFAVTSLDTPRSNYCRTPCRGKDSRSAN